MPTVRKYDQNASGSELEKWKSVGSTEANQILTRDPSLTGKTDGAEDNIENVLLRDREDIELLKKNVAWLALHGGGGYGPGGGGSSQSTATIQILDEKLDPTDSIIWSSKINSVDYKIVSRGTSKYKVEIWVNDTKVQSAENIEKNKINHIYSSVLNIKNKSVRLHIIAKDEDDNEYTASCDIIVANIVLKSNTQEVITTLTNLNTENVVVHLGALVNITGEYDLYVSRKNLEKRGDEIFEEGSDVSLTSQGKKISLGTLRTSWEYRDISVKYPFGENQEPMFLDETPCGNYSVQYLLVSSTNSSIFSSICRVPISIVETEGITVIPIVGQNEVNKLTIKAGSIMSIQFKVISIDGKGTYDYDIVNDEGVIIATDNAQLYGSVITRELQVNSSVRPRIEGDEEDQGSRTLTINARGSGYTDSANVFLYLTSSGTSRLEKYMETLEDSVIFDFTIDSETGTSPINPTTITSNKSDLVITDTNHTSFYVNSTTTKPLQSDFRLYQKGVDTTLRGFYLDIRHRAYSVLTCYNNSNLTGITSLADGSLHHSYWFKPVGTELQSDALNNASIINLNYSEFTFDIAYYIGKEDDDNVTVLRAGDYDKTNNTGDGILIQSHNYYIKFDNCVITGTLQDNAFNHLTIVSRQRKDASGGTELVVFKNGLYDQINRDQFVASDLAQKGYFSALNKIYLACESPDVNNCNIRLYSVRLFATPLNIGQILCSYINGYISYKTNSNNEKDPELLDKLLLANGIKEDKDVESYDTISEIYDFSRGEYNLSFNANVDNEVILNRFSNFLKIPTVILSTNGWTWSDFTNTGNVATPVNDGNFTYKDPSHPVITQGQMKFDIQGTTSQHYKIKNIEITFPTNITFSPTNSWFPESTFVLKADIVDSGHINNAVIGKFVNYCYNNTTLMNNDYFPMKGLVDPNPNIPAGMTAKACIEGFPVFVVFKFSDRTVPLGVYSFNLGRYSRYNLGYKIPNRIYSREGDPLTANEVLCPGIFGGYQDDFVRYQALCYEGKDVFDCDEEVLEVDAPTTGMIAHAYKIRVGSGPDARWQKYRIGDISRGGDIIYYNSSPLLNDAGQTIPYTSNYIKKLCIHPNGLFWSDDPSYAESRLWLEVENGVKTDNNRTFFKRLCSFIATGMDYGKGSVSLKGTSTYVQWGVDSVGNKTVKLDGNGNPKTVTVGFPQAQEPPAISVKNSAFYYVICMLFGLVDSLGKNLQMRGWIKNTDNPETWNSWSPAFYDMDTALGLKNSGEEEVKPTSLDYSLMNDQNSLVYEIFGEGNEQNNTFNIFGTKLWGAIESSALKSQYSLDIDCPDEYFYSYMWNRLRLELLQDSDTFISEYFDSHADNCGAMLMNLDYETKYIDSPQHSFLHGNRLDFIRNWLKERIFYLDSVFGYSKGGKLNNSYPYLSSGTFNSYCTPWKNTINLIHNSGSLTLPVETTSTVIMEVQGGGSDAHVYYTLVPKNTRTSVRIAHQLNNQNYQTQINNSSLIKKIYNLRDIGIRSLNPDTMGAVMSATTGTPVYTNSDDNEYYQNFGSLSELKELDLSSTNSITSDPGLFKLLKTWDNSGNTHETEYFKLEVLKYNNLSANCNMSVDLKGVDYAGLPSVYSNPFVNLVEIDVSESNVSSITIPNGISLKTLKINNSSVSTIELQGQPLLGNIDFSSCSNLSKVVFANCNKITSIVFNPSNTRLNYLAVSNCANLEEIIINADSSYLSLPNVTIEGCKNLKRVRLTGCIGENTSYSNSDVVNITNCPNIEELTFTESEYTKIRIIYNYTVDTEHGEVDDRGLMKLKTLKLNKSLVENLHIVTPENDPITYWIDLRTSLNLETIDCSNNKKISAVRFSNIKKSPIVINTSGAFRNCTGLTSIAGNIILNNSYIFSGCSSLKGFYSAIDDTNDVGEGFFGRRKNGHPLDIKASIGGVEYDLVENWDENLPEESFVRWNNDVNIRFTGDGAKGAFSRDPNTGSRGPGLCTFDIYCLLYNIVSTSVTSIASMFEGLKDSDSRNMSISSYDNVGTALNRKMFIKCINVTSVADLFKGTTIAGNGLLKLDSPTFNSETGKWNDDGIFSPLKKVGSFGRYWGLMGTDCICDRNLFKGETSFVATYLDFNPQLIVNDINAIDITKFSDRTTLTNLNTNTKNHSFNSNPIVDDNKFGLGNIEGIFENCTSLQTFIGFRNSNLFINFDKNPKFSSTVSSLTYSFICTGVGELKLSKLFKNELNNNLLSIKRSFIFDNAVSIEGSSKKIKFVLDGSTFKGCNRLTTLGNYSETTDPATLETPFKGKGLNKIILCKYGQQTNEDIIISNEILTTEDQNKTNWVAVKGLFREANLAYPDHTIVPSSVENKVVCLPGNAFKYNGNSNLLDVTACFYNFKRPFKFTEKSFIGCTNLMYVQYLFTTTGSLRTLNAIPLEFFSQAERANWESSGDIHYQGTNEIIEYTLGYDGEFDNTLEYENGKQVLKRTKTVNEGNLEVTTSEYYNNVLKTSNSAVQVQPISEKRIDTVTVDNSTSPPTTTTNSQGYTQFWPAPNPNNEVIHSYTIPNASIVNMNYCFSGLSIPCFKNTNYILEKCPEYFPWTYEYFDGSWSTRIDREDKTETYMWSYDGNLPKYIEFLSNNSHEVNDYEYLDEIDPIKWSENTSEDPNIRVQRCFKFLGVSHSTVNGLDDLYFCLPPDLLRYSTKNATITGIFDGCGTSMMNTDEMIASEGNSDRESWKDGYYDSEYGYGLSGRLCPYLLKPLPNTKNMSQAFRYAKWLGYYAVKKENTDTYDVVMIPKSFFSYLKSTTIDLSSMFEGILFPIGIDLTDVFSFNSTSSISANLSRIFANVVYFNGSSENKVKVIGVFKNEKISFSSLKQVFCVDGGSVPAASRYRQYVKFDNVFNVRAMSDEGINQIFYGFYGKNNQECEHEVTKTVKSSTRYQNYKYREDIINNT